MALALNNLKRVDMPLKKETKPNQTLLYSRGETSDLIRYSDADWAGDINDCKSTTDYLFKLGGAALSWKSQKLTCVALSTA